MQPLNQVQERGKNPVDTTFICGLQPFLKWGSRKDGKCKRGKESTQEVAEVKKWNMKCIMSEIRGLLLINTQCGRLRQ